MGGIGNLRVGTWPGRDSGCQVKTDLCLGSSTAILHRRGLWIKAELLHLEHTPFYAEDRRRLFEGSASPLVDRPAPLAEDVDGGVDLRDRLREGEKWQSTTARAGEPLDEGLEIRTLWVDFDRQGEQFKEWKDVCNERTSERYSDFPLPGPPSLLHLAKHMCRSGAMHGTSQV